MLTQNEKDWLAERDKGFFYSCRYCPCRDKQTEKSLHECMSFCWDNNILAPCAATTNELRFFQDAAEFEALVMKRLLENIESMADHFQNEYACNQCNAELTTCNGRMMRNGCMQNALKWARLKVEEEMENEK